MVSGNILASAHGGVGYEVLPNRNQQPGRQTRSNRSQISQNRIINSNVRNTENSESVASILSERDVKFVTSVFF